MLVYSFRGISLDFISKAVGPCQYRQEGQRTGVWGQKNAREPWDEVTMLKPQFDLDKDFGFREKKGSRMWVIWSKKKGGLHKIVLRFLVKNRPTVCVYPFPLCNSVQMQYRINLWGARKEERSQQWMRAFTEFPEGTCTEVCYPTWQSPCFPTQVEHRRVLRKTALSHDRSSSLSSHTEG